MRAAAAGGVPTGAADLHRFGVVGFAVHLVEDVGDLLAQRLRVDAVLFVVGDLFGATTLGLVDRFLHRVGDPVGVHVHLAGDVARRAADGLDEAAGRAQEPLLVGIENRHQRHLRQVEALAQQVDPDQNVVLPQPQLAQQLDPAQCVDLGVQVTNPDTHLEQVVGQVLGHLLGQGGHQRALVAFGAKADLPDQVVDLPLRRLDDDLRVDQAGRTDDLLDELATGLAQLIWARGRRQIHRLTDAVCELLPGQRTVVDRRRQTEPEVDQIAFT